MLTIEREKFEKFHTLIGALPGVLVKKDNNLVYRISSESIIDLLYYLPDDVEDSVNKILIEKGLTLEECHQIYPKIISEINKLTVHDPHPPEDF